MVQLPRPPYLEPVSPRTTPVQARRLTMYDLPSDSPEDSGLPDEFHDVQPDLLGATCVFPQVSPSQRFIGTDINLYYDERNPRWYKRPDWFVATEVPRLYPGGDLRLSYVVWIEGAPPTMVVELLSPGTEKEDLGPFFGPSDQIDPAIAADTSLQDADEGTEAAKPANLPRAGQTRSSKPKPPAKWTVYESILQIPYYFVFSRYTEQLRFFQLVEGRYQEQPLDAGDPRAWIEELQIGLGLWQGEYQGISRRWLRWFDASGHWILTEAEAAQAQAEAAQAQAEAALSRAEAAELAQAEAEVALEQERQRRSRLFEQLRQLGIDPDQLDQG